MKVKFFYQYPLTAFIACCMMLCSKFTVANELYGRITDENGEGLPFASVYIKNTTSGTTSNIEGDYTLALAPGQYEVVYRYVGYREVTMKVTMGAERQLLNVPMEPDVVELQTITVNANDKDPAYRVIRQAIKKRKKHLREVKAYHCNVYIKGLQRLDKAPKKVLGFDINLDTGIVYLSESISEFSFQQPDKIKERVISSKVSGNNNAFSYNQASQMLISFYENVLTVRDISERSFVSPIANNAFLFYRYQLDGVILKDGLIINKIKVIPIRQSDPVFSGYIYIIEDQWRIHSVDLLVTKANQIEFIDSLHIEQVYAPTPEDYWMMFSQKFSFQFKAFGFVGSGYFVGVHSDYEIGPEIENRYFKGAKVLVEEGSNKRDSLYWEDIRPIPLTDIEIEDYILKDSLQTVRTSKPYLDSVDRAVNKLTIGNVFLSGYTYQNSFKKKSYTFDPVFSTIQYNTVEGLVANLRLTYLREFEDNRFWRVEPEVRYGFSDNRLKAKVGIIRYYNPNRFAYGALSFGRYVMQYNDDEPISVLVNSTYTLLRGRNYMKLYEKDYLRYRHQIELTNGILVNGILEYAERRQLRNTTDYTFASDENTEFTPNAPVNEELPETSFETHQALTFQLDIRIRFRQEYYSRPNRKLIIDTKYPTVTIRYKRAFNNFLGSDIGYDRLELRVDEDYVAGLAGRGNVRAKIGTYFGNPDVTFIDYRHFNGNETIIGNFGMGNYHLLPYYQYSTIDSYAMLFYEHHFNGFIFNKFPLLRKLKLQAVGTANYLYTEELGNYLELGVGIEHIFKVARVDFFTSFRKGEQVDTGFRIGFGF